MAWTEVSIDEGRSADFARRYKRRARFLIDECLGEEAARVICSLGWNAVYVSELALIGHADEDIFAEAWRQDRVLLTHDHDFLDDRRFPPHRNPGLVVLPGAAGCTPILEKELARVLSTIGRHRDAYRSYKIHVYEDGTWAIRCGNDTRGKKLKFVRGGKILELSQDDN
jgi:predicted nuclease of predicted toxin-antitoxin system